MPGAHARCRVTRDRFGPSVALNSAMEGGAVQIDTGELLAFYRGYVDEVFRRALRLCGGDRRWAEDLTSEVFVRLVRAVQAGRIDVLEPAWLMTVLRNRFVDELRRREREERRLERFGVEGDRSPADDVWAAIDAVEALALLGRLPDDQRAALVFRYVDDLPVSEVATLLGRSPAATESLLARARRALAHHVEEARRADV